MNCSVVTAGFFSNERWNDFRTVKNASSPICGRRS